MRNKIGLELKDFLSLWPNKPLEDTSFEHDIFILWVWGRQRRGEKYLMSIYCVPRTQQKKMVLQILFHLIIKSSLNYAQPNPSSGPPVLAGWMSVLGMWSTGIFVLFLLSVADHKILIVEFSLYEDFGITHSFRSFTPHFTPFTMMEMMLSLATF